MELAQKTERGVDQFLVRFACAPHPLRFLPVAVRFFGTHVRPSGAVR
jgi:hypothetical protein